MEDDTLLEMYGWLDSIPLSREKKNTARDFCDGVLLAEIIKHYYPRIVELHNYPSASSTKQKLSNWNTLNMKVFKKLKFKISQDEINDIVAAKPKAIEEILIRLYRLIVKKDTSTVNISLNNNLNNNKIVTKEELIKLNENIDQDIHILLTKKESLEKKIQHVENENSDLQRQIEDCLARLEAKIDAENNK